MGVKERLKDQFRFSLDYLALRHGTPSDFSLSWWQRGQSPLPLLCVRLSLFLLFVTTLVLSLVNIARGGFMGYWPIYMTQWALITMGVCLGLGTAVSALAYFKGPYSQYSESSFGLPWLVRLYWLAYCLAMPIAFLVTIFYYSFLTDAAPDDYEVNPVVDVLTHGVNSVVMFLMMATSKQPLYFFQFLFPLAFLIIYATFSIIYYFAGGLDPFGEHTIYPMLDWANPGPTMLLVLLCVFLILGTTTVSVLFTMLRDYLGRRWNSSNTFNLG